MGLRLDFVIGPLGLTKEAEPLLLLADEDRTTGGPVLPDEPLDMTYVSLRFAGSDEVLDVEDTDEEELVLRLLPAKLPGGSNPL